VNAIYTLLEATLALYPADATGQPITTTPIWMGACAENLRLAQSMKVVETTPGGRAYPKRHPLVATHDIQIGRIWVLPDATGSSDYVLPTGQMVLDILWEDEEGDGWQRRTYYGVTAKSYDLSSVEKIHSTADQTFDAEYYSQSSGTGTPPALTPDLPYLVRWVSATDNITLYDYSSSTFLFTERTAGAAATRATITVAALFDNTVVQFIGAAAPALTVTALSVSEVTNLYEGVPSSTDLPRLDFLYGGVRLASISYAGVFFADTLVEAAPAAGSARYRLFGGGVLSATIAPEGTTFQDVSEV
jgi:hypothetical protein